MTSASAPSSSTGLCRMAGKLGLSLLRHVNASHRLEENYPERTCAQGAKRDAPWSASRRRVQQGGVSHSPLCLLAMRCSRSSLERGVKASESEGASLRWGQGSSLAAMQRRVYTDML